MDKITAECESPSGEPFQPLKGPASWIDVAFAPDGTIWGIGVDNTIWYCRETCKQVDGSAVTITVDSDGTVFVTNSNNNIYKREGP